MIHSCQSFADRQQADKKQTHTLYDGYAASNTHGMHATLQVLDVQKKLLGVRSAYRLISTLRCSVT